MLLFDSFRHPFSRVGRRPVEFGRKSTLMHTSLLRIGKAKAKFRPIPEVLGKVSKHTLLHRGG